MKFILNIKYNYYLIHNYGLKKYTIFILLKALKIRNDLYVKFKKDIRWYNKVYFLKKDLFPGSTISLDQSQKKSIDDYFSKFHLKESYDWHAIYFHLNGTFSEKYISDSLFYSHVEPKLNLRNASFIYNNKNLYDKLFPKEFNPRPYLRCINYQFAGPDYELINQSDISKSIFPDNEEFIIKPTIHTSKGKNIYKIRYCQNKFIINNHEYTLQDLVEKYSGNFIIQEIIQQNEFLKKVHPSSLNTLRIITLRLNNKYYVLSSVVRFGINHSFVDNVGNGGIYFGVKKDGHFSQKGYDMHFNSYTSHPTTKIELVGKNYPYYHLLTDTAVYLHTHVFHYNIISWDMALDKNNKPVFIENNPFIQEINSHQIMNGPLFGELTDEVLASIFK